LAGEIAAEIQLGHEENPEKDVGYVARQFGRIMLGTQE
jgi:hypothetical protein